MDREEHLNWCKKRALEYLPGDPVQAVTSMLSDLSKHEDTKGSGNMMAQYGILFATKTSSEARRFIEGFN